MGIRETFTSARVTDDWLAKAIIVHDNNTEEQAERAIYNGTRVYKTKCLQFEDYAEGLGASFLDIVHNRIHGLVYTPYNDDTYIISYDYNTVKGWGWRR